MTRLYVLCAVSALTTCVSGCVPSFQGAANRQEPPSVAPQSTVATKLTADEQRYQDSTVVQVDDLEADYDGNALAADRRYLHQTLDLIGNVASVDRSAFGTTYVELRPTTPYAIFRAKVYLRRGQDATDLSKDQMVTILARLTSRNAFGVELEDGVFQSK